MDGEPLKSWNVLGHSDGMRMDPATHLLWTTSNEDGNPAFATINTVTGVVTPYTFPAPPHQGGYDDLYFLNGNAFIAASNPTLDASGLDRHPVAQRLLGHQLRRHRGREDRAHHAARCWVHEGGRDGLRP
jgi:hypothetical protein